MSWIINKVSFSWPTSLRKCLKTLPLRADFVFQGEVDYWALFKLLSVPLTQTGRDRSSLAWVPRADLHPPEMPLNEQNIQAVTPDSQGKAGIASGFYQPHKKAPKWAGSGWVWVGGTQSLPFVLKLLGQLLCKASPSQTLQITIFFLTWSLIYTF